MPKGGFAKTFAKVFLCKYSTIPVNRLITLNTNETVIDRYEFLGLPNSYKYQLKVKARDKFKPILNDNSMTILFMFTFVY